MLVLHMESSHKVDECQLLEMNRRVFSLRGRQIHDELLEWAYEDEKLPLQKLIGRLLPAREKGTKEIWFH